MVTHTKLKIYPREEFTGKWVKKVWKNCPSLLIALPFPGGVLVGAEDKVTQKRVSFFLTPEDAAIFSAQLLKASLEADND